MTQWYNKTGWYSITFTRLMWIPSDPIRYFNQNNLRKRLIPTKVIYYPNSPTLGYYSVVRNHKCLRDKRRSLNR